MLSSCPFCNIHLIPKFYGGLKYIRAVPFTVLQKWGNKVKFWWWEFRLVSHQSGGLESCFPWGGGLIFQGGGADAPLHSMPLFGVSQMGLRLGLYQLHILSLKGLIFKRYVKHKITKIFSPRPFTRCLTTTSFKANNCFIKITLENKK